MDLELNTYYARVGNAGGPGGESGPFPSQQQAAAGDPFPFDMPPAAVVVLAKGSDGGATLVRYGRDGRFAGDTWHASDEDALYQAEFEFGEELGPWLPVPRGVDDLGTFTRSVSNG